MSHPLSTEEKSIVNRLTKLHDEKKLSTNDVITAYLDVYKQSRHKSKLSKKTKLSLLAKPIEDCLLDSYPTLIKRCSLQKGIRDTSVNRLLAWIGQRDFAKYGEPILKEVLDMLNTITQDSLEHKTMDTYWKSYQRGMEDKDNIITLIKLLNRLGPKGYELTSQLFFGKQEHPRKISEDDIKAYFEDKIKMTILQRNIKDHFMRECHLNRVNSRDF
ncbi:MAG: hypothetical protein ACYCQI_15985 [Gammaproteobacteria bacterium]